MLVTRVMVDVDAHVAKRRVTIEARVLMTTPNTDSPIIDDDVTFETGSGLS